MDFLSIFKGGKYFDKNIQPKCDYCQFGRRTKDGNKVLCEKRGMTDREFSCGKFVYSPLKRIPVKQLNFVGSLADEDIYIESVGDKADKIEENAKKVPKKPIEKKADAKKAESADENKNTAKNQNVPDNMDNAESITSADDNRNQQKNNE